MKLRSVAKNKRGMSIGDLYPVILIIATVAILLAIVMMVLTEWQGVTNDEVGQTDNETITRDELTAGLDRVGVDNSTACGATNFVLTNITNATIGDTTANSGNYTFSDTGIFTNLTTTDEYADGFNISYTYEYGGSDCSAVQDIIGDFTDFVPWIGIILLVIAAAIVLGIVISSFKKPRV